MRYMDKINYTQEKMENIKAQVQKLIEIVHNLEEDFPGRHFTLDGHLVGSIGEVLAAYFYGIELYKASVKGYDGEIEGRRVQIKITQQDNIVITQEPDYLIVLYLQKSGDVYEVYNGPGKAPWDSASKPDSHNNRHMMINKLMELDKYVSAEERIPQIHNLPKMQKAFKNVKGSVRMRNMGNTNSGKSTDAGYINKNEQQNNGRSDERGTDYGQWFYHMECLKCGYKYMANGTDIWQRKCPRCQGGRE